MRVIASVSMHTSTKFSIETVVTGKRILVAEVASVVKARV